MNSKSQSYYQAIESIMKTSRYITDQVSLLLKPYGITEAQYNVLRILEDLDGQPATIQDIQIEMYHQSSNVSRIIDKLLAKELVTREVCSSNRRKMDITLTDNGLTSIKEFNTIIRAFHQPHLEGITMDEINHLNNLLEKLKGGTHEKN